MNFSKILATVGDDYESSLRLVKKIKEFLSNAKYESISQREKQSIPSVYLQFEGKRPLVFDLRKSNSTHVFFWMKEHLKKEIRERYQMVPHSKTGWTGMIVNGDNEYEYREQLKVIVDYWKVCLESIIRGEHQSSYKRQAAIMSLALHAFDDYSVITDRNSVPGFSGRPDIYIPEISVVIEVDGKQHYEYVKLFHDNQKGFLGQKKRDKILNEVCIQSKITLLRIVEDAADLIAASSDLKNIVCQARERGALSYLVRTKHDLSLLNAEEFEEHQLS